MKTTSTLQVDSQPLNLAKPKKDIDWPLFLISGGFLGAFLIAALIDIDGVSLLVNTLFAWSTKFFGLYWQILMLATFAMSLIICFSKCGRVRLGGVDQRPDSSTFNWRSSASLNERSAAGRPSGSWVWTRPRLL